MYSQRDTDVNYILARHFKCIQMPYWQVLTCRHDEKKSPREETPRTHFETEYYKRNKMIKSLNISPETVKTALSVEGIVAPVLIGSLKCVSQYRPRRPTLINNIYFVAGPIAR